MPEVELTVAGRRYRMVCDAGQEAHLAELGAMIDAEARKFAAQSAAMSEPQLLLMAALVLADRLSEAGAAGSGADVEQALSRLEAVLEEEGA